MNNLEHRNLIHDLIDKFSIIIRKEFKEVNDELPELFILMLASKLAKKAIKILENK